jgi:phosphoglycolate phosphatase-like HAD superfamily hydrolase
VIRCVVFDFDGTLVDSNAIKRQTFFDVLSEVDPEGEVVAHVLDVVRPGDRFDIVREIARRLRTNRRIPASPPLDTWADRFADAYTRGCEEAVSKCPEIPGATAALEWLAARGLPCYVNSATPQAPLLRVIELRSWSQHFRGVLGRPASKLENLHTLCEESGATPAELLFVGDGEDDAEAARAFGCTFVAVVRPNSDRFRTAPALRIPDLRELPGVFERLAEETT